jgi:PAS domain S-box-containing protein
MAKLDYSKFFAILEAVPRGAYIFSLEDHERADSLRIIFANTASEKVLGLSADAVVGTTINQFFPNSLGPSGVAESLRHAIVNQCSHDLGVVSYGPKGVKERRFAVSILPHDATTAVQFFDNLSVDAPEGTGYAAIVGAAKDAIVSHGLDGEILSWNAGAEHLFGYSADEMIGRTTIHLEPRSDSGPTLTTAQLRAKILRGEKIRSYEAQGRRKDGSPIEASVALSAVYDSSNKIIGIASVARDISYQRRIERQLRQAQKFEAIGTLTGGIAHDFNNLLHVIRGYSGLLSLSLVDEKSTEYLQHIDQAAQRGASFIRQLLTFSRQQSVDLELIDLTTVTRNAIDLLRPIIGEDIVLSTELGTDLPPILCDTTQLEQVILNLAINARDAMANGGELRVRSYFVHLDQDDGRLRADAKDGGHVVLEVSDTGKGMDDATRSRVFDPYFTTKSEGTGLGLATVYGIVQQVGGVIDVESAEGVGTTITLFFPSSDIAAPAARINQSHDFVERGHESILVVEDNELVRELVTAALASNGYFVVDAANGSDAMAVAQAHSGPFDLLLTDVVMPTMNGRELVERLRSTNPSLKVLFSSGYASDILTEPHSEWTNTAFIEKPFLPDDLTRAVRALLDD